MGRKARPCVWRDWYVNRDSVTIGLLSVRSLSTSHWQKPLAEVR
jgi:hypothetical protein